MRHLLLTLSLFLSLGMLADHHKKSDENATENSHENSHGIHSEFTSKFTSDKRTENPKIHS